MPKNTTAYKKEYINEVDLYLKARKDGIVKGKFKVRLPTIEDFAINWLHFTKTTIYKWEKDDVTGKFRQALDKIKEEQKQRLINNGLANNYNPTIVKLILSNNHNMRERTDITSDDKPLSSFTDEQANKIADRIAGRKREIDNSSSAE